MGALIGRRAGVFHSTAVKIEAMVESGGYLIPSRALGTPVVTWHVFDHLVVRTMRFTMLGSEGHCYQLVGALYSMGCVVGGGRR